MLNFLLITILTLFASIFSQNSSKTETAKENLMRYWAEKTLYNFMTVIASDFFRNASPGVQRAFQICLKFSVPDSSGYRKCLIALVESTRKRFRAQSQDNFFHTASQKPKILFDKLEIIFYFS